MRMISRIEEIVLLCVWRLGDEAYGIAILEEIGKATGKVWLTGSIYACLSRLLRYGLVDSYAGEPLPERGGRHKIYYRVTEEGLEALEDIRRINSVIWTDIPAFEGKND
jgi:PadR family transcriptional regulator PadR